jgi:hypothetical protein
MEKESIVVDELTFFAFNIKKEVCVVLESFFFFLKKIEEKKTHNMFSLMLDPKFKSVCFVSSFIGREEGVAIVEEYDSKSLYPMLLKYHHHLHPLEKFEMFLLTLVLMNIAIWIHLSSLPTQVNQQKNL